MNQSVQESSGGQNNTFAGEFCAFKGFDADYSILLCYEFGYRTLPDIKIFLIFNNSAPCPDKFVPVTLSARTPHGRPFRAIEHPKLYGCSIRYNSQMSSESVYLPHYLSFSYSPDCGIAAHLGYFIHVHSYEAGFGTHLSRGSSSFATGMTGAYYNNIERE
jgi:hypothetical protein